jgi:hypothetical protein
MLLVMFSLNIPSTHNQFYDGPGRRVSRATPTIVTSGQEGNLQWEHELSESLIRSMTMLCLERMEIQQKSLPSYGLLNVTL